MREELLFEAEDRSFGQGLFVDLVPSGSWGQNLRAIMTKSEWSRLSVKVSERCLGVCEACNKPTKRIECHERWAFEESSRTQSLRRLVGLCSACHRATHFGFAQSIGRGAQALSHIQEVNGWTRTMAISHVKEAFETWASRSSVDWIVDFPLSLCGSLNRKIASLPDPRSPCVQVCKMENGVCAGCSRTIEQISLWAALPENMQRYLTICILAERR